jgi:DNA-binding NarL/FixJ family response regulator
MRVRRAAVQTGSRRRPTSARPGEAAVAAVERLRTDLVGRDVRMPGLDGIAATVLIKGRWPEVRVVAHSLAVALRADALAAGADAFVPSGASADDRMAALRPGPRR